MNFKSISILLVFTFVSTSVLCNDDLDDPFEGLEIYEEFENLTKTNLERGSFVPIRVTINATYACDKKSPFRTITSTDNPVGQGALPFNVIRIGLACTSLTKDTETANYRGFGRSVPDQNLDFNNLKTVILRENGREICTQTGTITGSTSCNGDTAFLFDTITQSAKDNCKSATGLTTQLTTTAVFIIRGTCKSKCTGQITYNYSPGLRK